MRRARQCTCHALEEAAVPAPSLRMQSRRWHQLTCKVALHIRPRLTNTSIHLHTIHHQKLNLLRLQDGKHGSVGEGWGRPSAAEEGDASSDGRSLLTGSHEDPNRGLLSADSLLYDSTGARRSTRFWRRS